MFLLQHNIMNFGNTTKFVPQSISLNSDFSSVTWSMTALSAGTDDIVAQSDVTPESLKEAQEVTIRQRLKDRAFE